MMMLRSGIVEGREEEEAAKGVKSVENFSYGARAKHFFVKRSPKFFRRSKTTNGGGGGGND